MNKNFVINTTPVGEDHPAYIIAELSANHEQDLDLAFRTIEAMRDTGANAVKVQTFTPESMTLDSDKPWFKTREDSLWAGMRLYDLYKKGYTPWEWHEKLQKMTHDLGMDFFSSPFDIDSVDKLASINVPAYKIASFEITDIPLIRKVAGMGKPVIISTGVAEPSDIDLAVQTCKEEGLQDLALLKCTSAYPTPMEDVNLNNIRYIRDRYETVVGLSDHTLGTTVPVASVMLGAKVIEKHFVLDRNGNGLDKDFSLTPDEFGDMVKAVRDTEKAMGSLDYVVTDKMKSAKRSSRSLFATQDIKKGEAFSAENVKSLRPGMGLHPKYYQQLMGKEALIDIERGTPLELAHFSN